MVRCVLHVLCIINDALPVSMQPVLKHFQHSTIYRLVFTVVFTHWWKVNEWAKLWLALCKNCLVESLWKHSLGEVKLRKTQQPYEIEIDHLIDFFLFFRAHVRLLYISTIKHQTSNTKATDLSRWATAGQNEKFCPFRKDKSRMEGPAGLLQNKKTAPGLLWVPTQTLQIQQHLS